MRLEIGNRIENHNGTFAKKVIDGDGDYEYVRVSKSEYLQQKSDIESHMDFLQRSFESYCLHNEMPIISADELIDLIVNIKVALKNNEDCDPSNDCVAIEVQKQYKLAMNETAHNCFNSATLNKRHFLKELEIHEQWLNQYINMHNLINI